MGEWIDLKAPDGHVLAGYCARPAGDPRGGILILPEWFGVNSYIKRVVEKYAAAGYVAVALALFDRIERGVSLKYDKEGMKRGAELRAQLTPELSLLDLQAGIDYLQQYGKVGLVGFCWGGSLAYLAAARLEGLDAAVAYYGGWIAGFAEEKPRKPTLLHFGETDFTIPMADVEKVKRLRPELPIYVYPAGHAFDSDERKDAELGAPSYEPASAALAQERTFAFIAEHVG